MKELAEGIFLFQKIIPDDICDLVVLSLRDKKWEPASPGKTILDSSDIDSITYLRYLSSVREMALETILKIYQKLREEGHQLEISKNSQPINRFIRYEKDADMKSHFDSLKGDRVISSIIYLNNNYEGGEICYPKQDLVLKPLKGSILIHPAIFTHPHKSLKITEGEKFICLSVFGLLEPS